MTENYIRRNPRTAWREYEGTTLVVTPDDSMLHEFNPTGTFIWQCIGEEGIGIKEIVDELENRYDASREELVLHVEDFIRILSDKHVLTVEQRSPAGIA